MNTSNPQYAFRPILWLLITLLLTGCNDSLQGETGDSAIPTLDNGTVKTFASKFQKDYDNTLTSLVKNFNVAYRNNDSYGFVDFRNNKWTPAYITKKNLYAEIFAHNEEYLKTSPIAPLFNRFENLIYIGINLKNGLLDNEQGLIDQALAEAKADQKVVHSIVASTK